MADTETSTDLSLELRNLEDEHRDLKDIVSNAEVNQVDEITLQRIKKRKLLLKDKITYIKSLLFSDIIA